MKITLLNGCSRYAEGFVIREDAGDYIVATKDGTYRVWGVSQEYGRYVSSCFQRLNQS